MKDAQQQMQADTLFIGGDIVTVNDKSPTAEALAAKDGRISAVGPREMVIKQRGPATEIIDLNGATLMPGLIEPHSHPVISALLYDWIDVSGFTNTSGKDVMDRLRKAALDRLSGEWITAFGYDPILIRDLQALNANVLDRVSSTNPIFVMLQSMHTVYVNHRAFELAGITSDTPQPGSGTFVKDEKGNLTGMVIEQEAILPFMMMALLSSLDSGPKLIEKQIRRYAKAGYTTVGAMGVFPVFPDWMNIVRDLVQGDECPIRMVVMNKATDLEQGIRVDFGSNTDRLSAGGAKIWYDGSFGTGNVLLEQPYLNSDLMQDGLGVPKDTRGYSMMPKDKLIELVQKYHDDGCQVSIHGQGDRALRDIIDAYEAALKTSPRDDHRHRIEHCALFPLDEMERAARLGLTPSWHINYIHYYGEALRDEIIGPDRANVSFPIAAAQAHGLLGSLHNDSPMYPAEPFKLLRTAVTRKTRDGETIAEDQAIAVDDAIKAITINAARQLFLDDRIGSLEAGKLADLTVVSENPKTIDPDRLDRIHTIATYREGRKYS